MNKYIITLNVEDLSKEKAEKYLHKVGEDVKDFFESDDKYMALSKDIMSIVIYNTVTNKVTRIL